MNPDVFISYSSHNRTVADAVCATLEAGGLRCWIAPRDIAAGADWGQAIIDAIAECKALVLVFSSHSNQSEQVKREVSFAVGQAKPILPLRIEDVQPSGAMLYYLGTVHWLDATQGPPETHLSRLAATVSSAIRSPAPRTEPVRSWKSLPGRNSLGHILAAVPADRLPASQPPGQSLSVSTTCVSNGDYLEFVRAGGPEPRGNPNRPNQRTWVGRHCPETTLDHPVIYVSHVDALLFCDWLTEKERDERRITPHQRYTLPSVEQWRAFVRGARLPRDAIVDRKWDSGGQPTVPVTWGEPSPLGLMHVFGNVFEWCFDATEKDGDPHAATIGGGWASSRDWLAEEVRKGSFGGVWRRHGLPMKDGGFRLCLATEAAP